VCYEITKFIVDIDDEGKNNRIKDYPLIPLRLNKEIIFYFTKFEDDLEVLEHVRIKEHELCKENN
jgi:hypothetical protein